MQNIDRNSLYSSNFLRVSYCKYCNLVLATS